MQRRRYSWKYEFPSLNIAKGELNFFFDQNNHKIILNASGIITRIRRASNTTDRVGIVNAMEFATYRFQIFEVFFFT